MKRLLVIIATLFVAVCVGDTISPRVAIVPQPISITEHSNFFCIKTSTTLVCEAEELAPIANYTCEYIAVQGVVNNAPQSNSSCRTHR